MANVIWDIGGINHVEFLSCRATLKSEHCCHVVSFVREKNSLQGQYFNTDDKSEADCPRMNRAYWQIYLSRRFSGISYME